MKRLIFPLLICFSCSALAQNANEIPFITKSFSNESIKRVIAETAGGNISVFSVAASNVRVEVYIRPSNYNGSQSYSKEEIQKRLEADYHFILEASDNTIKAIAKNKNQNINWKKALSISYKIFVPKEISTNLTTSGGNITLADLNGSQHFVTSGGNLDIERLKGKVVGVTSGGNISVSDCSEDIELTTSGGDITADNCNGKISLVTSGGDVKLNKLEGTIQATTSGGNAIANTIRGSLEAHTSGGNVNLRDLYCSVDAGTSGGNIFVSVKEIGSYIRIANSSGKIELELPSGKGLDLKLTASKIKTNQLNNFSGTMEEEEINGKLNGGGIPVTVKAGSGKINFTLK
ncbi:MAG: DUF4097 family beta strand repeat-containing protein [Chitinophagaceae bacterium]